MKARYIFESNDTQFVKGNKEELREGPLRTIQW